jgi:hypothetical protein
VLNIREDPDPKVKISDPEPGGPKRYGSGTLLFYDTYGSFVNILI